MSVNISITTYYVVKIKYDPLEKAKPRNMKNGIPIIDVFAGPGGLGEGFSALGRKDGQPYFNIGLSVEKDSYAHSTLELRSFFRQFPYGEVPEYYYAFLRHEISREELFQSCPEQARLAKEEAWCAELGSGQGFDNELVFN